MKDSDTNVHPAATGGQYVEHRIGRKVRYDECWKCGCRIENTEHHDEFHRLVETWILRMPESGMDESIDRDVSSVDPTPRRVGVPDDGLAPSPEADHEHIVRCECGAVAVAWKDGVYVDIAPPSDASNTPVFPRGCNHAPPQTDCPDCQEAAVTAQDAIYGPNAPVVDAGAATARAAEVVIEHARAAYHALRSALMNYDEMSGHESGADLNPADHGQMLTRGQIQSVERRRRRAISYPMTCEMCGWQGHALLDDQCPKCDVGGEIVPTEDSLKALHLPADESPGYDAGISLEGAAGESRPASESTHAADAEEVMPDAAQLHTDMTSGGAEGEPGASGSEGPSVPSDVEPPAERCDTCDRPRYPGSRFCEKHSFVAAEERAKRQAGHDVPTDGGEMSDEPMLGLATTKQLIDELAARADVSDTIGQRWPSYRTVDESSGEAAPSARAGLSEEVVRRAFIEMTYERGGVISGALFMGMPSEDRGRLADKFIALARRLVDTEETPS